MFVATVVRDPWRYVPILVEEAANDPHRQAVVTALLTRAFDTLAWGW